jgi:hypothetical protein
MASITKKPRKIKVNSVVNDNNYNVTQNDSSTTDTKEPELVTLVQPKRYNITKDKTDVVSMDERNKATNIEINSLDFSDYKPEEIPLIKQFIQTLSNDEKKALLIARNHLGTSFDIVRCNHFQTFLKTIKK